MSTGSKAIIEQRQEEELRSLALKNELFKKYGGNEELSMVDIYIKSQGKARYVTEGI